LAQSKQEKLRERSEGYELSDPSSKAIEKYSEFEKEFDKGQLPIHLELAASIHYLIHVGFVPGGKSYENIREALRAREKVFTDGQFDLAWKSLIKFGLTGS
jgi:hypothetical protein